MTSRDTTAQLNRTRGATTLNWIQVDELRVTLLVMVALLSWFSYYSVIEMLFHYRLL